MTSEEAVLIVVTSGQDDEGFPTEKTTEYPVFVREKSATRAEFYAALNTGITINAVFEMRLEDFNTTAYTTENNKRAYATKIRYDGATYDIVRTYKDDKSMIQLICV